MQGFREMSQRFPQIDHWMIGRGLIADPFLPSMIKDNSGAYPEDRMEIFGKFHDTLFNEFENALSGPKHILMKMHSYWEYFGSSFEEHQKLIKKIKKAKSINAYEEAVRLLMYEY